MQAVYGDERIIGEKFPMEGRHSMTRRDDESEEHFRIREYILNKRRPRNADEIFKKSVDMNPNGFWECNWSVRGISYTFHMAEELDRIEKETEENMSVCKIVSQGLIASDPRYISKVVYMYRHPRAVAKSQERLIRGPSYTNEFGDLINTSEEVKIHTPEMFIEVTVMAAAWKLKYPDIPFLLVKYDELIDNPEETLNGIGDFLNIDMSPSFGIINRDLRRSRPEEIDGTLWEDAEFIYEKFLQEEYQEVVDYVSDQKRAINRSKMNWYCPRAGRQVNESICKVCVSDVITRENFIHHADSMGIDWINEPCPYECGFNMDVDEHMTIEDSVMNNFWLPERVINATTIKK